MKIRILIILLLALGNITFIAQAQPTSLDPTFLYSNELDGDVTSIALQPDGKIIVAGTFGNYNTTSVKGIARLNSDGTLDGTFNTGQGFGHGSLPYYVHRILLQPNGKIIAVGEFTTYDGNAAGYVVRINSDGSYDNAFNTGNGADGYVYGLLLQPNGQVIVGGRFDQFNGQSINDLVRLNTDGSTDATFSSGTGISNGVQMVYDIEIESTGKLLISGNFTDFNGIAFGSIARLNTNGSIDNTFNSNGIGADGIISEMTIQPDGKILIAGNFGFYNGTINEKFTRLQSNGSIDFSYLYNLIDSYVLTSAIDAQGNILLGGVFSSIGTDARMRLARVSPNGIVDQQFDPGTGTDAEVASIVIQPDGKILVGGYFWNFNNSPRRSLVRLMGGSGTVATNEAISNNLNIELKTFHNYSLIQFSGEIPNELKIEVMDLTGKQVVNERLVGQNEFRLEYQGLAKGGYVCTISSQEYHLKSLKFIVK